MPQGTPTDSSQHQTDPASLKVSTLELFFDLIFVFTITQLTELVIEAHQPLEWLRIPLLLSIIWWIYAGYVWLTNNSNLQQTKTRVLILLAMVGFLVMALAIPSAFDAGGLVFALAYFLVMLIHFILFNHSVNASSVQAIWRIAPYNFGACLCFILAAFLENPYKAGFWILAVLILISSSFLRQDRNFVVSSSHFAERHGLVILIALGESVVGIGVGAKQEVLGFPLIFACLLGLVLNACLWWIYFDHDDHYAEQALARATGKQHTRIAASGYGYAHFLLILGIIILAAGIKQIIAHLHNTPPAAAWSLGIGIALYLLGQATFRQLVGITPSHSRLITALFALATIPIGIFAGGFIQIIALVVVLSAMLDFDKRKARA